MYCKTVLHNRSKAITKGNLALWGGGGEKAGTCSECLHLSITPAYGTLYTGLFATMACKMMMPIFHFVAR